MCIRPSYLFSSWFQNAIEDWQNAQRTKRNRCKQLDVYYMEKNAICPTSSDSMCVQHCMLRIHTVVGVVIATMPVPRMAASTVESQVNLARRLAEFDT